MSNSLEVFRRVYDNASGDFYQVRPDSDGLGLIEVSVSTGDEYFRFTVEEARLIAKAIALCAEEVAQVSRPQKQEGGEA